MAKQVLSYHLAEAIFTYIYSTGQPIFKRVNLMAFIDKCAVAMLTENAKGKQEEIIQVLDGDIAYLRKCYEPALDEDSSVFEKRVVFESFMDDILLKLLTLISDNNLVDQKTLSEVYATKWTSKGKTQS